MQEHSEPREMRKIDRDIFEHLPKSYRFLAEFWEKHRRDDIEGKHLTNYESGGRKITFSITTKLDGEPQQLEADA